MTGRRPIARVWCDKCDQRTVYISDLTVRTCVTTGGVEYRYRCPTCLRIQLHPVVREKAVEVLALCSPANQSRPARLETWDLPEPEKVSGPPLSMLDLIALVDELDGLPSASEQ